MILTELQKRKNDEAVQKVRDYHKIDRPYLGLRNDEIEDVVKPVRQKKDIPMILTEADTLWASNIYEARVAVGKLLTLGKLNREEDEQIWQKTLDFAQDFDSWAIADHMAMAAYKRLLNVENRWKELTAWTTLNHLWRKRGALVYTLPIAKKTDHPALDVIYQWMESYTDDHEWFIQKAIAWWLRDHSKVSPSRVLDFLDKNGERMKPFAKKEASKYLSD